jgi:hypothetical protein
LNAAATGTVSASTGVLGGRRGGTCLWLEFVAKNDEIRRGIDTQTHAVARQANYRHHNRIPQPDPFVLAPG